jgi:hypothetical protein
LRDVPTLRPPRLYRTQHPGDASVTRKVSQEVSWEQAIGAVEQLTEIARAHQALLIDLIDGISALYIPAGAEPRSLNGNR